MLNFVFFRKMTDLGPDPEELDYGVDDQIYDDDHILRDPPVENGKKNYSSRSEKKNQEEKEEEDAAQVESDDGQVDSDDGEIKSGKLKYLRLHTS